MSIVPNTLWSWKWKPMFSLGSMNIPLALQAFLQNQVDQIFKETHRRDWHGWTHEDLRATTPACRRVRKQGLLSECPGMLSGLGAVALIEDVWTPAYVLSVVIPGSALAETSYSSDFRIINVVWEHTPSGNLSITLYNNHLDGESDFRHVVTEGLSTKRRPQWTLDRKGNGFLRAVRVLMTELYLPQNVPNGQLSRSVTLRVGDSVGEFGWSESKDGQRELMLRQYELRPLSLADVQSVPDFVFPFDQDAPRVVREFSKEKRVAAIYRERFLLRLSQKTIADARATEPAHERPLVQADEVLVIISGLNPSYKPETLFSTVWSIFPPQRWSWAILLPCRNLPEFVIYKPSDESGFAGDTLKPRFFHRGYLIPSGPPLNRLGVNYSGDLDLTDSHAVAMTGTRFCAYILHLGIALNMAFCTMPELASELATDILTDSRAHPYSFGRVLSTSRSVDEDGKLAYRAAFETAWRRLDPSLADPALVLYPHAAGDASEEKVLIERLGMRPVHVQPHVQHLLEKTGVYPPIKTYAEALLLSSPGTTQQPYASETLVAALSILFPMARGDILSLRRYDFPFPRVVWDVKAEIFVMSASVVCEEHESREPAQPCSCWVCVVLLEAVASWRSKTGAIGAHAISDAAVFRALLQCTHPGQRATSSSSTASIHTAHQWDDGEIEYADLPTQSEASTGPGQDAGRIPKAQAAHSLAYPSPVSPRQPRRRTHARSPTFVITPLPSKRKPGPRALPTGQGWPVDVDTDATDLFADDDRVPPLHAAVPPRVDMSDIMGDMQKRVDRRVRAIQTYHAREREALQDELARAHSTAAELQATLAAERAEHDAVVAAKEEALAARELALEDKDAMLRARDGVIGWLREGLKNQTRRATGLEADVRRKDAREKRERARLRTEVGTIHRRLLDMFRAQSEREDSVIEDDSGLGGGVNAKDDEYDVEGSEPAVKRMRLQ